MLAHKGCHLWTPRNSFQDGAETAGRDARSPLFRDNTQKPDPKRLGLGDSCHAKRMPREVREAARVQPSLLRHLPTPLPAGLAPSQTRGLGASAPGLPRSPGWASRAPRWVAPGEPRRREHVTAAPWGSPG